MLKPPSSAASHLCINAGDDVSDFDRAVTYTRNSEAPHAVD
jgi:hypothetical protein